jgi:hypothetical protein
LQRRILCTLLRKPSLGLGPLVLDLLLALVLLRRKPEPKADEREREYEQRKPVQPVFARNPQRDCFFSCPLCSRSVFIFIPHVLATIITNHR